MVVYGNLYYIKQNKNFLYIVEVNKLKGSAAVKRANSASPTPRAFYSELAEIVVDWRTVTADLDLQKRIVERLSYFFIDAPKGFIIECFEENNPYKTAKENRLIQVEIKELTLPVSNESWKMEWTEEIRNYVGNYL
jgi:type IV secretion system protein VirB5